MKIYVLMQRATEYNDEYDVPQEDGGKIYKAFRNKPTQEQIDAAAWDATKGKQPPYDGWPTDMAYVEEIEVDDSQVIQPSEVKIPGRVGLSRKSATYTEAKLRAQEAKAESSKLAKQAFTEKANELFAKYPDLISFTWTQYTPYFNDGDECIFRVYSEFPNIEIRGFDIEEGSPVVMYFKQGNSDKAYVVDEDWKTGEIKFSYGRRGSALVTGVKPCGTDADSLVQEKKNEGYGVPYEDVQKLLQSFDEEDMKDMFGDHVEVTATREAIKVEEYSHD